MNITLGNENKISSISIQSSMSIKKDDLEIISLIDTIKNELNSKGSILLRRNYHRNDVDLLPQLVENANKHHDGLNLHYIKDTGYFLPALNKIYQSGVTAARFVVCIEGDYSHSACADFRRIGNHASIIFFEPGQMEFDPVSMMNFRITMSVMWEKKPHYHLLTVPMAIQKSAAECTIFSLFLAKKAHKCADELYKLHNDNICDRVPLNVTYSSPSMGFRTADVDNYLPVTFFKHVQSEKRLMQYLNINPEKKIEIVNKKGETILERFQNSERFLSEDKNYSLSVHYKRVQEYQTLVDNKSSHFLKK